MRLNNLFSQICTPEQLLFNEPMKSHTSFQIGGPADLFIQAGSVQQIVDVVHLCRAEHIPLFVTGNGSNLLVSDKGIEGVVLAIAKDFSAVQAQTGRELSAQAGILLSVLANVALEHSLSGLAFASGIPGSLGGAVFMNAGAYGGEMKDVVKAVTLLMPDGEIKTVSGTDMQFAYRKSAVQQNGAIILSALLSLSEGNPADIKANMLDLNSRRKDKQPLDTPSAGSTFKRPEGHFAGKLIMDSGLKGFSIGGAQVSEKHCGFIINKGNATAQDVLNLIEHVKETVYKKFGLLLEPEIRLVGR